MADSSEGCRKPPSAKVWPNSASEYVINKAIGSGTSATVYSATCPSIGENCAIKILNLDKCENNFDNIQKEIKIMTMCDHPNVIRYYTSFVKGVELWIVMPLKLGSISYIMQSCFEKGLPEASILKIIEDVLHALVYLHEAHQVHRDIKGSNILMDKFGQASISDLGVASWTIEGGFRTQRQTLVGSPCWMAPEVIEKDKGYNEKVDIWSLGITALELASGEVPFCHLSPVQVWLQIVREPPPTLDQMLTLTNNKKKEKEFSKQFREFISLCLRKDPQERPSAKALLALPIFKHIKKLKRKSPTGTKQKGHGSTTNIDGLDQCDPSVVSSHAVVRDEVIEPFLEWSAKKDDKPITKVMKEREKRIEEIKIMTALDDDDWDFSIPTDDKHLKDVDKSKRKNTTQSEPIRGRKKSLDAGSDNKSPKSSRHSSRAISPETSEHRNDTNKNVSQSPNSSRLNSPSPSNSSSLENSFSKKTRDKKDLVPKVTNVEKHSKSQKSVFKVTKSKGDSLPPRKGSVVVTCVSVNNDGAAQQLKKEGKNTGGMDMVSSHHTTSSRRKHHQSTSDDGTDICVKKGRFIIEKNPSDIISKDHESNQKK